MKRIVLLMSGLVLTLGAMAQTETATEKKPNSIKVGNVIIEKKADRAGAERDAKITVRVRTDEQATSVSVNNLNVDVTGFNSWSADTTKPGSDTTQPAAADTIRVGGMVIIRKGGPDDRDKVPNQVTVNIGKARSKSKVSTNWWIVDLGFANVTDNTNYASAEAQAFAPGFEKGNLDLRTGKSVNVNLWIFMQKVKLIQDAVSLKYGLGLELNNYRFDDKRVFLREENPTQISLNPAQAGYKKNKLAADYVTVPLMLNFNLSPKRDKGFGFSAGVSGGYLYSARQKFKDDGDVSKNHDNYDLRKFKLSYIGELNLGPVRLYGSVASKSMWERGLDQTPFNVGIRLGYL